MRRAEHVDYEQPEATAKANPLRAHRHHRERGPSVGRVTRSDIAQTIGSSVAAVYKAEQRHREDASAGFNFIDRRTGRLDLESVVDYIVRARKRRA